jgi:YD repeat-containing protein
VNDVPTAYTYLKNGANPPNGQRLSSNGVNACTWDANGGNLTRNGARGNFTFGYDPGNRLTGITGADTATLTCNYDGRGAWKTRSDVATSYAYDGLDLIRDDTGPTTRDYVVGPSVYDQPAVSSSHIFSFTQEDPLSSPSWLAEAAGAGNIVDPNPRTLSIYRYIHNAPTVGTDPSGLARRCSLTGNCPDCPNGHWGFFTVTWGGDLLFAGNASSLSIYHCIGTGVTCVSQQNCWRFGLAVQGGFSVSGGVATGEDCVCGEDLGGETAGADFNYLQVLTTRPRGPQCWYFSG